MKSYWSTFTRVLLGMLDKPMWMMLLLSLCLMSMVYARHSVWDLPVGIVDQDHSTVSHQLIRSLDATPKIATKIYDNLPDAQQDLAWRKLFAVIIMPVNLEKKILHGEAITVPVYGDATNRLANGQIEQDVIATYQQLLARYNNDILLRAGFDAPQAELVIQPFVGQTLDIFNPGISFAAIIFPGLLVMLLQHSLLIASVRVSLAIRSSGKPTMPVYLGALSALLPIWMFLSIVLFVLWPWVLGYRQTAPIPEVLLLTFPFVLAVLGLGKLLTECLQRVELIYLTLSFVTMPVFYLSGTIWPLQAMPAWVHAVSASLPSTWATKAIAGVNQMGLHFSDVLNDLLILLFLGAFYALLGTVVGMLRNGNALRTFFKKR